MKKQLLCTHLFQKFSLLQKMVDQITDIRKKDAAEWQKRLREM